MLFAFLHLYVELKSRVAWHPKVFYNIFYTDKKAHRPFIEKLGIFKHNRT